MTGSTGSQSCCTRPARHTIACIGIVDGDDPDWASWYAEWLRDLSELPQILGAAPVRSELVWLLVTLDQEYTKAGPSTPWPRWYAERMLEHFATPPGQ
jgi:hypothetical protein